MPVMEPANLIQFTRKQCVFREGDELRSVFRLSRGLIRYTRLTAEGRTLTLRHILPGDLFGEEVYATGFANCTAEVMVDAVVEALDPLTAQLPEISLSRQLTRQQELAYRVQVGDLKERVMAYLRFLAETPLASETEDGIAVSITHELLSEGTNSTRESVSKVIADLKAEGVINSGYRSVVLL